MKIFFVQFFCVFLSPLLNIFCFCWVHTISVLYQAQLCMKCSLGISNFLEEISSLSHSTVFLYFFALITEGFLISPCYSLELCIQMGISFLFASLLFTAICKASSDSQEKTFTLQIFILYSSLKPSDFYFKSSFYTSPNMVLHTQYYVSTC